MNRNFKILTALLALGTLVLVAISVDAKADMRRGDRYRVSGVNVQVTKILDCIGGSAEKISAYEFSEENKMSDIDMYLANAKSMSCSRRDSLVYGLQYTGLILEEGTLLSMCIGAGAPVSVALAAASLGTHFVEFYISNLSCENDEDDARNRAMVQQVVCEVLARHGIDCNP